MKYEQDERVKAKFEELAGSLGDYAAGFFADIEGENVNNLSEAIWEYADSHTSIYYSDIIKFIAGNVSALEDAINEGFVDMKRFDLYEAGQAAEFMVIENALQSEADTICEAWLYGILYDLCATLEEAAEVLDRLDWVIINQDTLDPWVVRDALFEYREEVAEEEAEKAEREAA